MKKHLHSEHKAVCSRTTKYQSNISKKRSMSRIFIESNRLGEKVLYSELVKLCIVCSWEMFIK